MNIRYKRGFLLKWGLIFEFLLSSGKSKGKTNGLMRSSSIGNRYDAIISDNRYGLYHKTCPVFLLHINYHDSVRLGFIKSRKPRANWALDRQKILKWNYRFIQKFSDLLGTGLEGEFSVAGILSHPPNYLPFR